MKKIFFISFCLLVTQLPTWGQLTQENAWNIVKNQVLSNDTSEVNVFISRSVIPPNSTITTINGSDLSPSYNSWFIFIDDMPYENWGHPCRYIYVNSQSGDFEIFTKMCPPQVENMVPIAVQSKMEMRHQKQKGLRIQKRNAPSSLKNSTHNYAVIISGGASPYNNHERYWNDCSAIYQTLVNLYGYLKDHIYILMSDGTNPDSDLHLLDGTYTSSPLDLDGDGFDDIQYAATRSNVTNVFSHLDTLLTEQDNLFVFTTDHGGQISGQHAILNLWNYEVLHDYEFATYINQLKAGNISICMEQCYSGGFIDDITRNNVTISSACRYDEMSYSCSNLLYDEYVYHWISAVAAATPEGVSINADANNDGYVSIQEAFCYAELNDTKNEHPQYMSNPSSLGNIIDLNLGCELYDTKLVGPNKFNTSQAYYLKELPEHFSVSWSIDNPNFSISSSDTTCVVSYAQTNYFDTATLTASVMNDNDTIKTLSKQLLHRGEIEGDAVLCNSNTYRINSYIDDIGISWSIDNLSFIITSNDSLCTVTYNDTLQYDTSTLTASITQGNDTLVALTKKIVFHGTNLFVEGWQEEVITPNGTSPENHFTIPYDGAIWIGFEQDEALEEEIDDEMHPIPIDSIFIPHLVPHKFIDTRWTADIYGGTWVRLTSTRFDGMDITFSGRTAPERYYRPSAQEIRFLMPYMEYPYTIDLCATSSGGCHDFNLRFNVKLLPGDVYGDEDIYVHFVGSQVGITLMCAEVIPLDNGQVQLPTWSLGIVNAQTGQWVHNTIVQGYSTSVNTARWNNGIYIIRAGYNKHIYTKTFTVSH